MAKLIQDYLDNAALTFPNKIAFYEEGKSITYKELRRNSITIANEIMKYKIRKRPIAIFLNKSIYCIEAFFGIAYSGNFYTLIDTDMPKGRINKILDVLKPSLFITDNCNKELCEKFIADHDIINLDNLESEKTLGFENSPTILSTDVLYVLFTSGSTGTPKGVVTPHKSVTQYIDALSEAYHINESTIMGNQVPFYFVMSIVDIYATVRAGASMHIIPKGKFSFPGQLVEYIAEHDINFISWVPSALCSISTLKAFKKADMSCLKTVVFGGEVMPIKHLNRWRRALPNTTYINGYGPTEVTDGCTYYIVDREFEENETLPIGKPFSNSEIIVLNSNNEIVINDEVGELCVRSDSLTYGYYNEKKKTDEVFVQNPLNPFYEEKIYRTGDLVKYNVRRELIYVGRKDFQIKHMGRRIELGEIESNISSIKGVEEYCCLYNADRKQIVLFYSGVIDEESIAEELGSLLPAYMRPNKRIKMAYLPKNVNGKIDRTLLKEQM